jgi:phosphate/sulfate permease
MTIFYIFLIILFALAVSDLVVGVSNDAVNFVNSAVGSKAAKRRTIMLIATVGVIIGTLFSGGMMDIAKKGIFDPGQFVLFEIMVIFLAVMFTDVLLLDLYNTFGMPTSTTVSLIFEMLGAAVAVSLIKIYETSHNFADLMHYINTSKALAMISAILTSVVVSFTVAAIFQFFVRMVFTFDYQKKIRRYGALWGAIALTFISYFLLMKGLKGAVFITDEFRVMVNDHLFYIMLAMAVFWFLIFQLLVWFTKINILKIIVLGGTFALAMAFAANDLVNFLGVPLAGLSAFQIAANSSQPLTTLLEGLKAASTPNTIFLLLAGIIMSITLMISKKARTVTRTEVNLGRQWEGYEKFESSMVARMVVRMSITLADLVNKIVPKPILTFINKRFKAVNITKEDPPEFDLLRASVNLMVASSLISFATSLKLPLSTTYVTFMAAMGTSLSDRAWGRESAVYRVNGVFSVIGGWFLTAFLAFTVAAIVAILVFLGKVFTIFVFTILSIYFIYKTHTLHKQKELEEALYTELPTTQSISGLQVISQIKDDLIKYLGNLKDVTELAHQGLYTEKRKYLKNAYQKGKKLNKRGTHIVNQILQQVKGLDEADIQRGGRFGRLMSSIFELQEETTGLSEQCFKHVNNNHSKPQEEQIEELKTLQSGLTAKFETASWIITETKKAENKQWLAVSEKLNNYASKFDKKQVTRLKKTQGSTRTILLLLSILAASEKISHHLDDLIKSYGEIVNETPVKKEVAES